MLRDKSLIPLSHQHQHALAMCVLTRRSMAADNSAQNIARLSRSAVDRFEIEIANHFELEEEILFPLAASLPLIPQLLREHRAIEQLIATLRTAPSAELLEQLCTVLPAHVRREENGLFEEMQRIVPRDVLDRAGEEIERRVVRVCL